MSVIIQSPNRYNPTSLLSITKQPGSRPPLTTFVIVGQMSWPTFTNLFTHFCRTKMYQKQKTVNSLKPIDTFMYVSVNKPLLFQITPAWSAPSHYLNKCWTIVNWTIGIKFQWNPHRNLHIFIQISICHQEIGGHFVSASMCWIPCWWYERVSSGAQVSLSWSNRPVSEM